MSAIGVGIFHQHLELSMEADDTHALAPFLKDRLPELGLDYETYGPYILPLLVEDEVDPEEWESVMELLQASSESHSDDNEAWALLRKNIDQAWEQHQAELTEQQAQFRVDQAHKLSEEIERERQIAQEAAILEKERKENPPEPDMDEARKALVARFAYDIPDDETEEQPVVNNKKAAADAKLEQARELRAHKVSSKKEEQQKTAQAKAAKIKAKEDRRSRATKGERKR